MRNIILRISNLSRLLNDILCLFPHLTTIIISFRCNCSTFELHLKKLIVMSIKSTTVRARLEPELKQETELIFEQLGINTTEAIRIFFKQVKLQRGLPFEMKIPNEITENAILDAKARKNVSSFESSDELFEDLDI
jgi:DNA-damage-inducible protein J